MGLGRILLIVPVALLLTVLTLPAVAALSRYRELAADRSAALLTGSPAARRPSPRRCCGCPARWRRSRAATRRRVALANALLVMPAGLSAPGLARVTATQPPVQRRVERLLGLESAGSPT
jgi:heat shock protein HtpX